MSPSKQGDLSTLPQESVSAALATDLPKSLWRIFHLKVRLPVKVGYPQSNASTSGRALLVVAVSDGLDFSAEW